MITLVIDTATTACAIAISHDGRVYERVLDRDRRHTEVLMEGIVALCAEAGSTLSALTRIVVDKGPGLFTGLRVGLATARALADATGASLHAVTSLSCYAQGAHSQGYRGEVIVAVDGRRGEVFTQLFSLSDVVTPLHSPEVETPRQCVIRWATDGRPLAVTGDGVARYRTDFAAIPGVRVIDCEIPPLAWACANDASYEDGPVAPLYLREADAVPHFAPREQ
jgi:tRNA threonylcarbamoyladenosine biosynthesis protein TsaB